MEGSHWLSVLRESKRLRRKADARRQSCGKRPIIQAMAAHEFSIRNNSLSGLLIAHKQDAKFAPWLYSVSEIQMLNAQRIRLNEFAARLNHISHQFGEDVVSFRQVIHLYLQ